MARIAITKVATLYCIACRQPMHIHSTLLEPVHSATGTFACPNDLSDPRRSFDAAADLVSRSLAELEVEIASHNRNAGLDFDHFLSTLTNC
jgi:hypothetical protein